MHFSRACLYLAVCFSMTTGTNVPRQKTTPLFKTPPLKENPGKTHLALNKEPSPAAIFSLLHGQVVSPQEQQEGGAITPCKSTKDVARVAAAAALTISPRKRHLEKTPNSKVQSGDLTFTPLAHRGGANLAPPRDLSLMLSPGVLASYLVSNTPSSLARPVDRASTQLATSVRSSAGEESNSRKKPVRTLTYETEDPLQNKLRSNVSSSPLKTCASHTGMLQSVASTHFTSPNPTSVTSDSSERNCQDSRRELLYPPTTTQKDGDQNDTPPISPSVGGVFGRPANVGPTGAVCLLTDLDPSIENESASMMAFALCTPTKDDPKDFLDAFT